MSGPFIFMSNSRIKEGKLEDFRKYFREMAEFVEANEPRVIAFEAYFSDDGTEVTGVQIHPDAASMEFHMQVALDKIMKFDEVLETKTIDVYGTPSDAVMEMLEAVKKQLAESASLSVRTDPVGGFARSTSG